GDHAAGAMDPAGQPARHRPGVRTGRQLSADTGAWRRTARPAVDRELKGVLALAAAASRTKVVDGPLTTFFGGRCATGHLWPGVGDRRRLAKLASRIGPQARPGRLISRPEHCRAMARPPRRLAVNRPG